MQKKKIDKEKKLLIAKRAGIALAALSVAVVLFLLLLPKQPDIVKGVTYSLSYPKISHYSQIPAGVFENDFKRMKEAGINTIRLYALPPEFILDLADKYKIKVIETIVFPGDWTDFNSPYQLQALKREAIRNIKRDINRECIYAWSIWNDAPWTYGSGKGDVIRAYGEEKVSGFLGELCKTVKKQDPLRPVTAATLTVNEEAKRLGTDFLDILGYNIYLGVTDWQTGKYDPKVASDTVNDLVELSKKYQKPVLITETGYSTFWKSESQENVIRDQIAKTGKRIAGIILFQWADDWSKAGNVAAHNDNVEEHWGILEGARKSKGGYYAVKQMFRNTVFRNLMLAISDYFRGSYFAAKKRVLRKEWKEDIVSDKEIDGLQNKLSLEPDSEDVPDVLERLSQKFFEKNAYAQFTRFLKEYASSYEKSAYKGLVEYYIALSEWNKLEYLAAKNMWELYYAEKTRYLEYILQRLESARQSLKGKVYNLKVLYLEWAVHNDLLDGKENIALEQLQKAVENYCEATGDASPLMTYSLLLKERGEVYVSEKLLREYASSVGKFMNAREAIDLLKEKADSALNEGNSVDAKILYDAYVNNIIRRYSGEEAAFAILELAQSYRRRALFDESIEMSERLLREFPDSELVDDAAYAIGAALKEKKSYSKAIKAFRDFIMKYPHSDLSQSAIKEVLSIFTVYGKDARAEKTVSFLKDILALYPDTEFAIMVRFELASSFAALGKFEEAMREYQYIIDNYPDSDYAPYSKRSIEQLNKE